MGFVKKNLKITMASFEEATNLQDAVANALKGNGIDIPENMDAKINVSTFLDAALNTISDKAVRESLFECAKKALYLQDKIDTDFFEKEENRELYYPIMLEILKVNVGPFLNGLLSMFGGLGGMLKNFQK
jgi:hypothetical protein